MCSRPQKLIEHTNGLKDAYDSDLWAEVVLQAGLDATWGACGFLIPNTQYGRSVHLSKCEACSTQVAGEARRDHGGNDSAFIALGGLTTQSLDVNLQSADVAIGSLRLRGKDCGWLADAHSNVCFYMSCADGNPGDALALK